jgi:hypothetical protein
LLGTALDIKRWLHHDRDTPFAERLQRDRAIGERMTARSPDARVLAWWSALSKDDSLAIGERVEALRGFATVGLFTLGLVMGAGLAGVAFGYRGQYPVNLFALLGVLVGIPLVLLLATLLLLPVRLPRFGRAMSGLNLGRWVGVWLDRVSDVELFAAFPGSGKPAPFARWQLLVFTQWLTVGYFVGVIGIAWLLVIFTDLAFGWSTTLELDSTTVHGWFAGLAVPWSAWLGVAVSDPALVEASRFFRLEEGGMPIERVEQLGNWWPFVLMVILVYGFLPRVMLLGVGTWRLRVAIGNLLRDDAEVTALLDRLSAPNASFDVVSGSSATLDEDGFSAPGTLAPGESTGVLIWNDALSTDAGSKWIAGRLGVANTQTVRVNIMQSMDEQRSELVAMTGVDRVVIFVKGWEPPILEFSDFLDLVREVLGREHSLMVVPIDVHGASVLEADRTVWARALGRADGHTYVVGAKS